MNRLPCQVAQSEKSSALLRSDLLVSVATVRIAGSAQLHGLRPGAGGRTRRRFRGVYGDRPKQDPRTSDRACEDGGSLHSVLFL